MQNFGNAGSPKKVRHVYPRPGVYTIYVPDVVSRIAIAGYDDSEDTDEERAFFRETAPPDARPVQVQPD